MAVLEETGGVGCVLTVLRGQDYGERVSESGKRRVR